MILACLFLAGSRRLGRFEGRPERMVHTLQTATVLGAARRAAPAAALVCCLIGSAHAVPVLPGANGFGTSTPAGRGGMVYRVTNLNERGTGSLGACVAARGPRVCIFEISGTIRLTDDLVVNNGYLTIAGQTAPAPGIMLRGAALRIQTNDVLVQHLRVRAGDDLSGPPPDNRDALKIEGNASKWARNIVIDHCSFSWAIDETATAWNYYDDISYLNNIFAEPLRESLHSNQGVPGSPGQGFGLLLGSNDGSVSIVGNLLAHIVARNPASLATRMVFANNVVYNRANMDVDLQSLNGRVTRNTIVGNVFIRGPDYTRPMRPVNIRTGGTLALMPGSRVYVRDNVALEATADPWSVVSLEGTPYPPRSTLEVLSPPVSPKGLVPLRTSGNTVYESVLASAGARPAQRDAVDQRIVQSVRSRTGRIINCVAPNGTERCNKNAGGWPVLAVNRRPLTLPADPDEVQPSGYTNLEVWLHAMAAGVEGVPPPHYPGSPSDLRVQ